MVSNIHGCSVSIIVFVVSLLITLSAFEQKLQSNSQLIAYFHKNLFLASALLQLHFIYQYQVIHQDSKGIFQSLSQASTCLPHTAEALHCSL